jgi:hypothetical protein
LADVSRAAELGSLSSWDTQQLGKRITHEYTDKCQSYR